MQPSRVWPWLALLLAAAMPVRHALAQPGYADLQVSYTNSPAAVTLGQYFTCSVYVYNPGWEIATNIVVTNQLPAGLQFVSVSSTRGTYSQAGGAIVWDVGNFLPTAFATMTIEFRAAGLGLYTNAASVTSATPDGNPTNNQAKLTTHVTRAKFFGVGATHAAYLNPSLTLLTNNQVLVVGQHLGKTTDLYNASSRTFNVPAGTMIGVHEEGSATLLANGLVLIAGGLNATGAKTAELYNPATQLFRQVGDMLVYAYTHRSALQPDGTVLLCGGTLATNQLFNPATELFSVAPAALPCPPSGERLPDGRYFQGSGGGVWIYDPVTGISSSPVPMNFLRFNWTATLIPPDKVLVAGGDRNSDVAEIYDIPTGKFSIAPRLTTPRLYHRATLLPDNTVLLVGGSPAYASPYSLTNAEVFDPTGDVDVPGVGINDATGPEGDSGTNFLAFNVWLTAPSTFPVSVDFSLTGGTANSYGGVAGFDFVPITGTVSFPPGVTNQVLQIPIIGEQVRETNETFWVSLKRPVQTWVARPTALGIIVNDDSFPTITITPIVPNAAERDSGVVNLVFNAVMSAQSLDPVTVDFFTSDGTAQAGTDYVSIAGTLTYEPGETNKILIVQAIGDLLPEPDETFTLNLTNAQGASISGGQALGTILNDDGFAGALHHFDIAPITGVKTQTFAFPLTITARDGFGNLVANYAGPLEIITLSTNVGATNLDFEQSSLSPWVPAFPAENPGPYELVTDDVDGDGRLSTAFRMRINPGTDGITQDVWLTGGKTYRLSVSLRSAQEGGGCWVGAGASLSIGNSNAYWNMPDLCGGQSARQTITLDYTAPTNGFYPLNLMVSWGNAAWIIPADYFLYADNVRIGFPVIVPNLLTNGFTNGVWSGMVTALQGATNITIAADDSEGHKGISNPFDVQPIADLAITASSAVQGTPPLRTGMKLQFNLAVTNRGPSTIASAIVHGELPQNLSFLSATNAQGSVSNVPGGIDWNFGPLPAGSNFTAVVVCRADVPGDFTNTFTVTAPVLDLSPTNNSVALSNHIDPPLLVIGDASGTEAFASATGMVFNLTLSGPSAQTINVDYLTVDGTATNNLDFLSTNATVSFAPGTTNAAIVVYAIEDILDEPNRSFTVALANPVNAIISDDSGTGTVIDDDPPPTISIADVSVSEGDSGTVNAVFQLTLSKLAIVDVSVRCTTAANTASTNDYTHTSTTVVFPIGSTNASFSVPVRGNTVNEPTETFFVNLTLPSNATIARTQAVGTIINDDAVPGRLDHFAWDPIPSPRYRDWQFPVTLRALDYLGNPATNGLGNTPVIARTENGFLERLFDDFEDGDSLGWSNYNASFSAIVTNETAAGGLNSLRLTGSTGNYASGFRRGISSNSTPNKITFSVRANRTNQVAGRFVAYANSIYRSAVFYFNNNGQMGLLDRSLGFRGVPYQSNRWYQVALTMNWAAQKIDCRIDGVLVLTNITFPDSISTMDAVVLNNQDNTTSWWDDLRVFHDNLTNSFSITPSNFTGFSAGVKSNLVAISGQGTNTFLVADDGFEHVGTSAFFDLLAVPLTLVTPASVTEGSAPVAAQVRIPVSFPQPIVVALTSSVPSELTVPATVTIPPGQTNAGFNLTVIDDALLDGAQLVSIIASVTNFVSAANVVSVADNEPAALTLSLPATALESAGTLVGQGTVTASAPPNKSVAVTLTSSDTNVVQVPASVTIQSNQIATTFNITIVDDQRIDGTQSATITASVVNWTNNSKLITVTDNETTDLRLTGPAQVSEGDSGIAWTIAISGTLTTNLPLALTSSATNTLQLPPTATIIAGQTSVVFTASAVDNALFDGSRTATLSCSALGFSGVASNVLVLDNDIHHLNLALTGLVKTSSVPFAATISVRDIFDGPETAFNGTVSVIAAGSNGPVLVQPANVTLTNGSWSGMLTVFTAESQITLQAGLAGGPSSEPTLLQISAPTVFLAPVTAGNVVYSPTSSRVWVTSGSTANLVPIDPFKQIVEAGVSVGAGPALLVTSGQGEYLHLAANTANPVVRRLNATNRAIDLTFSNQNFVIEDMTPMPDHSESVAICWRALGTSPWGRHAYIYDNGIARSNFIGGGFRIEFGESPNRLYLYDAQTTTPGFGLVTVDAGGLVGDGGRNIMGAIGADFVAAAGWIFTSTGEIYDAERGVYLGSTAFVPTCGSRNDGRYFQWQGSPGRIVTYDIATRLAIGSTLLPGVNSASGKMVRWGTNGLAFSANSTQVAIVRTPLIPSGPPADLVLAAPAPLLSALSSNLFVCPLTISNRGPNEARNVMLAARLPANANLVSITTSGGGVTQSTAGLICPLGNLSTGGVAVVSLTFAAGNPGLARLIASATSDSTEANATNNVLNLPISVRRPVQPDSVVEIKNSTTDIIWSGPLQRIFASIPFAEVDYGSSLLSFHPESGGFDLPIPTGIDPSKLAVSSGGEFVYTALQGETSIQRVNTATRSVDQKFPTIRNTVFDMEVVPNKPDTIVATVYLYPEVVVYSNGVILPDIVEPAINYWPYTIEFGASPSVLYVAWPGAFRKINIGTNGATIAAGLGVINGYDTSIEFDAGRMFTGGGRVFDPETGTVLTNLPISGLVMPDAAAGRVFYLTGSGTTYNLTALNFTNFEFVGSVTISNVLGTPTSLIRWGTDGLAFRTSGGQIFVIRTTLADDRDNDTLPDTWEIQYFGSLSAPNSGPDDDPDNDGFTNLQESRAGLAPLVFDAVRFLRFQNESGGGFEMTIVAHPGQSFALMASTNLTDWIPIGSFTCTDVLTTLTDAAAQNFNRRFYRLAPVSTIARPRLALSASPSVSTNGVELTLECFPGVGYRIEASSDLTNWTTLTNFVADGPIKAFRDSGSPQYSRRFYRAAIATP